jgi:Domain of unknown function (DUF4129)
VRRSRWLLAPIAALVGTLALAAPIGAQTQLSPEEFLGRIGRARELARLEGTAPSPARMADVREALGLPVEIVIGDWSGAIRQDPILEGLSGDLASDFGLADERLVALGRSLEEVIARQPRSASSMADALAGAYRGVVPPRPNPFEAVLQFLQDVFQAIVQRIGSALADAGSVLMWVALVAIIAFAAWFLLRSRLVPDRGSRTGVEGGRAASSVDWAARADQALLAGDLQEAVRASYLALLAVLAGRGIVANAPALTAGEARFAVRRVRPSLFPTIAQATDSYERVIYGGATPDRRDVERLREATAEARKP